MGVLRCGLGAAGNETEHARVLVDTLGLWLAVAGSCMAVIFDAVQDIFGAILASRHQ